MTGMTGINTSGDGDGDVQQAVRRLAAAGLDVDEQQALEALSVSREAVSSRLYRALAITGVEPMSTFDPRWRR
jgi:L-lysine 2,3-aminomutase